MPGILLPYNCSLSGLMDAVTEKRNRLLVIVMSRLTHERKTGKRKILSKHKQAPQIHTEQSRHTVNVVAQYGG